MSSRLAALSSSIRLRKSHSNALYEGRAFGLLLLSLSTSNSGAWSSNLLADPLEPALPASLRNLLAGLDNRSLATIFSTSLHFASLGTFGITLFDGNLFATFAVEHFREGSVCTVCCCGGGIESRRIGFTTVFRGVDDNAVSKFILNKFFLSRYTTKSGKECIH